MRLGAKGGALSRLETCTLLKRILQERRRSSLLRSDVDVALTTAIAN